MEDNDEAMTTKIFGVDDLQQEDGTGNSMWVNLVKERLKKKSIKEKVIDFWRSRNLIFFYLFEMIQMFLSLKWYVLKVTYQLVLVVLLVVYCR